MEKILVIRKNLEKVLYGLHKRSEKTWFFKYGNHGHKKTRIQTGIPKVLLRKSVCPAPLWILFAKKEFFRIHIME